MPSECKRFGTTDKRKRGVDQMKERNLEPQI